MGTVFNLSSTAGYNLHLAFLHGNGYCSIHSLFLVATISYSACRIAYLHAAGLLGLSFEVAGLHMQRFSSLLSLDWRLSFAKSQLIVPSCSCARSSSRTDSRHMTAATFDKKKMKTNIIRSHDYSFWCMNC